MSWSRRLLGDHDPRPDDAPEEESREPEADGDGSRMALARKQIRGSSMLLSGRGIALGLKFLTQLLLVRYLSTADYGAWAYALAAVTLLGGFSSLSLDRAVTRFASIYLQRSSFDRFFGTLVLVAGMIVVTGILFATGLFALPEQVLRWMGGREEAFGLLFVLIFLVPLEALDQLGISIFATLGRAGAIFFRKYLLGPILQLAVVVLVIARGEGLGFLAVTYLAATVIGVVVNGAMLVRLLEQDGLLRHFRVRSMTIPARELFGFAAPLMTSDWLAVLVESSGVLLLGYFVGTQDVALLRAVMPLALLNQVVVRSFNMLYVPAASRLFARGDRDGIHDLYRRMSLWVSVLSFPIFAVTFATATPLVVLLFDGRYEASGAILSVLALGVYAKTSLAFSGATLKVLGRIRYLVVTNLAAGVVNVGLNLLLIPRFGAMGAACAMSATLMLDGLLKQTGVRRATGGTLFSGEYLRPRLALGTVIVALVAIRSAGIGSLPFLTAVALSSCLAVLYLTRRALRIEAVFPEIARVPILRGVVR